MAINYTWDVSQCAVYPTKSGKSNVVHKVYWVLKGTDDANNDSDGNPQTAKVSGSQELDISDLSNFTNWSSLDAAKVQGWVESALGSTVVAARKAYVDQLISERITPVSVVKTLG
tara:strand:- start:188 stop:532 length:345 start_codon:yes stop_codon:yes gene_type:complete